MRPCQTAQYTLAPRLPDVRAYFLVLALNTSEVLLSDAEL
eukprot:SAG11_NODE_790_length_7155_cov_217.330641_5_plen_40_part_00